MPEMQVPSLDLPEMDKESRELFPLSADQFGNGFPKLGIAEILAPADLCFDGAGLLRVRRSSDAYHIERAFQAGEFVHQGGFCFVGVHNRYYAPGAEKFPKK